MNSKEIRKKWLDFFNKKGHEIIESKNLIPVNDPSLLWINSGVATLKDYFSGKKIPPSQRLTNSQKAIRTNDIENVGITSRHHTFFEMLGNFSIGDYFKKEAIDFGKEFLFDILKLEKEKIYITYFNEDEETKEYWIKNGIDESHLIKGGRDTNFWDVGSGPCGPCTEIFYDRGEKYDKRGIELLKEDIENDRYIEIWNIVFSQFNNDGENNYTELNQKNIDTGAGLERIASILQDVPTNFDTDLFQGIIKEIEKFTNYKYDINNYFTGEKEQFEINKNFKIIADHIRTVVNAIADGAKVSNVGRGYIIRRLIRRSVYKGMQLGIKGLFLYKLVKAVQDSLPYEYDGKIVAQEIKNEEILFSKTIEKGKSLLENHIDENTKIFNGEIAFNLLETYGFPIELTEEILNQKGIKVDLEGFKLAKEKHAEASRSEKISGMATVINSLALIEEKIDEFIGYSELTSKNSKVLKLLDNEKEILSTDSKAYLILDKTPFYATSGGQRHDKGYMIQNGNKIAVLDVFKDKFGNHIHLIEGKINNKDIVECYVDPEIRIGLERNHSGTHLLFCALRNVLGNYIEQLGSDNNEERLTFDFPGDEKPTEEQINKIESLMHQYINMDVNREYLVMPIDKAKELGALMTIEEEEYMDPKAVRVVRFGDITSDLCGGTHLSNTKKLENFKITNVERKQAGIYRIRAISSNKLVREYNLDLNSKLTNELNKIVLKNKELNNDYKFSFENLEKLTELEDKNKELNVLIEKAREDYKILLKEKSVIEFDYENVEFEKINNYNVYINLDLEPSNVKVVAATIRDKYNNNNIVVTGSKDSNQTLLSIASKIVDSNKLFRNIASKLNGRGGGSSISAMGKVDNSNNLISIIKEEIKNA
ncbi:Alanine--tRNA ligase [Mycoplasmopsis maculosa]|uniref:Alanine--tRNA ligase n=1 Tax=Mycoplasmopsis maculosa TaxID=114885 RepID=A0A449B450_9BACT|nr:alanine--tRNA ligase [Mycoplasmopsis maculosa]VEU75367.1 Alanine--tRNA ligase [Mycoplasmopsis maculosa]